MPPSSPWNSSRRGAAAPSGQDEGLFKQLQATHHAQRDTKVNHGFEAWQGDEEKLLQLRPLFFAEPVIHANVFSDMAVSSQQNYSLLGVIANHLRHPHITRYLRIHHAFEG
jgi:hypothetical protein